MATLNVITICGSLRKGSFNAALARALPALAPAGMSITAGPSFAEFPLYNADVHVAGFPAPVVAMAEAIRQADGVIIVSPEYNWSMPGVLKNAVDWVSRLPDQPIKDKPIALQSASPGPLGAARMQYHLRQALLSIEALILTRPEIFVGNAAQKFDDKTMALKDQPTIDIIKQQLVAFEQHIQKMARAK